MVKREIESTEKGIDKLVYELSPMGIISHKGTMYGLMEEEIKIVKWINIQRIFWKSFVALFAVGILCKSRVLMHLC